MSQLCPLQTVLGEVWGCFPRHRSQTAYRNLEEGFQDFWSVGTPPRPVCGPSLVPRTSAQKGQRRAQSDSSTGQALPVCLHAWLPEGSWVFVSKCPGEARRFSLSVSFIYANQSRQPAEKICLAKPRSLALACAPSPAFPSHLPIQGRP